MDKYNDLISEFVGIGIDGYMVTIPDGNPFKLMFEREHAIQFDNSYEWLMKVVEIIEEMGYETSFKTRYCRINPKHGLYDEFIVWALFCGHTRYRLDGIEPSVENNFCVLRESIYPFDNDDSPRLSKFEMIHICVVEFIKWYNKQK